MGKSTISKKGVINAKTNFHTASVSKLFTAQAIIDLVYENKLAMEDKLVDLIPNLKYSDNRVGQITLLSLLNHSSGLGDIKNYKWYKNNHSDQALTNYFLTKKLNLKYPPHTTYHYSNLGYNLLGRIIEKVTGKTFEDYLKEKVLNPFGMLQSDFRYFMIADSIKSTPHRLSFLFKKMKERKIYPYTREHAASSTLNSSVSDLSQWMLHFLNHINLESGLYKKMFLPSFEPYPYIGLGYQLGRLNGFDVAGHLGGDKGFRSYLLLVPKLKMGVVLLANCDYNEDFRQEIVHPIVKKNDEV